MKRIIAKYDSICYETKKEIKKGDYCYYSPTTRKVYHDSSKTADQQRESSFNQCFNMPDASW